ncbi:MAG: TlpA disulfide reductase family protein [Planctomycetota bacterium]|jgi:thiol-disulfide isomerase/thioredoxin
MKIYYLLPLIILIVIPGILVVGAVVSYRKHRTIFHCLVCILVLWLGIIIGMGIKNKLEYKQHQVFMADRASHLMDCVTLIREGDVERGINALDGEISMRLKVSAWGKNMNELPQEILTAWQEAKVYYAKYNVVGYDYNNDTDLIRNKLNEVPWSQYQADKRAFEAKYKTGTPQIAPELDMSRWIGPSLSLDELREKVVILDIWGLSCAPCIAALPDVQKVYKKFKDKGLVVIAVHGWGGDFKKISQFIEENNYSFPVGIDAGMTVRNYAVFGVPSYYLIDKKGCLVWGPEHEIPSEELIESMLEE